jgi:hypothetical protein
MLEVCLAKLGMLQPKASFFVFNKSVEERVAHTADGFSLTCGNQHDRAHK